MSDAAPRFTLRPAQPAELATACELGAKAAADPARALGYPRWDSAAELLAEFALYESDPQRDLWVALQGERAVAVTGILAGPADERGFLIGPAVYLECAPREILPAALREVERLASHRLRQLSASVQEENAELCAALEARGWQLRERDLEMKWTPAAPPVALQPLPAAPRRLRHGSPSAELRPAAELLAREFGWQGDAERRLREDLAHTRADALGTGERCSAAIVWGPVPGTGFARLDFLAVAPELRGRGLGSALLAHALAQARGTGIQSLYLSVRHDSPAARLYARHGFAPTRRIAHFAKDLER